MIHHFWQWCKMMTISDPIKKILLYSIRWPLWCENSYETVLFSTCKNPLPRIVSIPSGVPKKKKSDTGFRVSAFLHWSSRSIDGSSSDCWSEVIVSQINTLMRANRPESRINRAPWHFCGERDTRPWDSGKQCPIVKPEVLEPPAIRHQSYMSQTSCWVLLFSSDACFWVSFQPSNTKQRPGLRCRILWLAWAFLGLCLKRI